MAMGESLCDNSPLPPLKHNSHIPMTLNITHLSGAGPEGPAGHRGATPGQVRHLLLGPKISSCSNAGHSCCQKIKKSVFTVIISFTKKKEKKYIYRFTHYLHFPHPVLLMATCLHHLWEGCGTSSSSSSP